jgi:hypothetical protein
MLVMNGNPAHAETIDEILATVDGVANLDRVLAIWNLAAQDRIGMKAVIVGVGKLRRQAS